jgi:putative N6-adenine-specific DNA methylase
LAAKTCGKKYAASADKCLYFWAMYRLAAQTFFGLEDVLAQEITALGGRDVEVGRRAVTYKGDRLLMYKSNYWLRTALNVLVTLAEGRVNDRKDLYDLAYSIPWEDLFSPSSSIAVGGASRSPAFRDNKLPMLVVKDAVADRFRDKTGRRPNVNKERPDVRIHLRLGERDATISLDSSGDPLFKRGYRTATNHAPINEVLAAGLVLLSGWTPDMPLVDPMCGSGTIPIEAALIAAGIPPAFCRERFAFRRWRDFSAPDFELARQYTPVIPPAGINIIGADLSAITIRKARLNLEKLPENVRVKLVVSDISDMTPPAGPGVLITNPPYGERLRPEEIDGLYKKTGDAFKKQFQGYNCWVISSNIEAFKAVGLTAGRKIKVFNGALECSFRSFSMYEGTRKGGKQFVREEE